MIKSDKIKRIILLWFEEEELDLLPDNVRFVRHRSLIRRDKNYKNFYWFMDCITNLYYKKGVFSDEIFRYILEINKSKEIKGNVEGEYITCIDYLIDRINELFFYIWDVIVFINDNNYSFQKEHKDSIKNLQNCCKRNINIQDLISYFKDVRNSNIKF